MDLLEQLALSARCEYLSDLRYMEPHYLRGLLLGVSVDNYSLKQWLDAEDYLCRPPTRKFVFKKEGTGASNININCEDVRQRMIGELSRSRRKKIAL
jgi:hypothetical protein